jgi:Flp pilus assembly protein CpaB
LSRNIRIGLLVAILGVGFLIIGVYMVTRLAASAATPQIEEPVAEPQTRDVVVAARDVMLGTRLVAEDLTTIQVPIEMAPRDVMIEPGAVVGRMLTADLVQGEMVLNHRLADPTNFSRDLAYQLEDDQVLMAFDPADLMSTLNIIQRGDLVDILVTISQEAPQVQSGDAVVTELNEEEEIVVRNFTFAAMQRLGITAVVVDVVQAEGGGTTTAAISQNQTGVSERLRAYMLALSPQDALVIKHLRDIGARFDLVIRAPTSEALFDLRPVISEYLVDRYQLEIPK